MKITIEKKLQDDGSFITTEELHIEIPQTIIDEFSWDDGTVVEWEKSDDILETAKNGEMVGKVVFKALSSITCEFSPSIFVGSNSFK